MKTTFRALIFLAGIQLLSVAEETAENLPTGFIRLVNGVAAGEGNVKLEVDGQDMRPKGYKLGDATGGIGLRPGARKVTIRKTGVKEGSTTIQLDKDQTVTVIPYAEKIPATDQEPGHFAIRILRLKQRSVDEGRTATFVSVSANPELKVELQGDDGKWATVFVKRLSIGETPLTYSVGYAPTKVNGKAIKPIPIGGPGNYVIVLYDDPEGNVQSIYFRDFKFLSAD
jgi:hypothetical protein